MSEAFENILSVAMKLTPEERVALAQNLYASVEEIDPEVEAAWGQEIKRRLDAIDAGEVELIPWEQVEKEMQELLDDSSGQDAGLNLDRPSVPEKRFLLH